MCPTTVIWVKAFLGLVFTLSCSIPHSNPGGWPSSPKASSSGRSNISSRCALEFSVSLSEQGRLYSLCQHWIFLHLPQLCILSNPHSQHLTQLVGQDYRAVSTATSTHQSLTGASLPSVRILRCGQEGKKTRMWGSKWKNRLGYHFSFIRMLTMCWSNESFNKNIDLIIYSFKGTLALKAAYWWLLFTLQFKPAAD